MIGVLANPAERAAVAEFFELFKTPWEFYQPGGRYDVLLSDGHEDVAEGAAPVVVIYGGGRLVCDAHVKVASEAGRLLVYRTVRIPVYGKSVSFSVEAPALLADAESQAPVAYLERCADGVRARIGYDLFAEVRTLLTAGQPAANAGIPALDLHIAVLRDVIVAGGVRLAEIPPVPAGYRFIACLTHDVDHPSIRSHRFDHTVLGFLYRAILGSLVDAARGRIPVRDLLSNWNAAFKLPFVHLGLVKDFWREFAERYLEVEKGHPSTFFVIPFADRPGRTRSGPAPAFRAARYGARDIADKLRQLLKAGCEVGLHGIDAWMDACAGRKELEEIRSLTKVSEIGVRMHWLYFDQESPQTLEKAGATYDSTFGYNQTVGYRAGTTQVFRPLGATRLLELPLHVMDTALFYPTHLALSRQQAAQTVDRMVNTAAELGGTLTVNWHDRSLAAERQWGGCYRHLVSELQEHDAWFATAGQAAQWFRKRRMAGFECDSTGAVKIAAQGGQEDSLPGLRFSVHDSKSMAKAETAEAGDFAETRPVFQR